MLSKLFLGISLMGSEWVLYFLVTISLFSMTIIFERTWFYRVSARGITSFRIKIREEILKGNSENALETAKTRVLNQLAPDLESEMIFIILSHSQYSSEILTQLAQDAVVRARLAWDKNLHILATIGNNAPFVGLFGTVLGIIKAFHDLSEQTGTGPQTVTSGISEALVATAVGLLVAIPAVIAFNLFQRRVKSGLLQAEALKSFLIGNLTQSTKD